MAEIKTTKNEQSVEDFLNAVENEQKRNDAYTVLDMMKQVSGEEPKMWGTSIVGFGTYHYKGKTSEGEWMVTGFSPRKAALTIYGIGGLENEAALLGKLGKYTTGKGCLYIKKLSDVDMGALKEIVEAVVKRGGTHAAE